MESPAIAIQFFGAFALRLDGKEVGILPKPTREVLAHLATAGGKGVDRAEIAANIWPNADPERAQFYLRRALTQLRSALEDHRSRLASSGERKIAFDFDGCQCDLLEFESAARSADADALISVADASGAMLLLGHQSDWVRHLRDVYRTRYIELLVRLAAKAAEGGQYGVALNSLKSALRADPVREETLQSLMRLFGKVGDFAGVERAFRDLRLALKRDMELSPSQKTVDLYRKILSEAKLIAPAPDAEGPTPPIGLPAYATPFFGRESEIDFLSAAIQEYRLVTLTGLGGVGKSRLAVQVARDAETRIPCQVAYADLSGCATTQEILDRISRALGVSDLAELSNFTLLLLDQVEQAGQDCREAVRFVLAHGSKVHIVCTTQAPLQMNEEQVVVVDPMRLPVPGEPADSTPLAEAVGFFLACGKRVAPGFQFTPKNADQVVELCRRLDGLPLALELAAARLRTLPISDILVKLDDRFRLLDHTQSQKTLRGVLEWSLRQLPPPEALLFSRLSVFPATWTVAAAQAICSDDNLSNEQIPLALAALVDFSLVVYDPGSGDGVYRMLETVRSFAREQSSEVPARRKKHAEFYFAAAVALHSRTADPAEFQADEQNFQLALDTLLAHSEHAVALRYINLLFPFWCRGAAVSDALRTITRVIDLCGDLRSDEMAEALFRAAGAAHLLFKMDLANGLFRRAEAMADQLGLHWWSAESLRGRGELAANEGRLHDGEALLRAALDRFRDLNDRDQEASCLRALGYVKREANDLGSARHFTEAALAIHVADDNTDGRLWCLGSLAAIHTAANDPALAEPLLWQTVALQEQAGNIPGHAWNLTMLAGTLVKLGKYDQAEECLVKTLDLSGPDAEDFRKAWPLIELGELQRLTGRLDLAHQTVRHAHRLSKDSGSEALAVRALLVMCRIAIDSRDLVLARAYRSAATEALEKIQGPHLQSELDAVSATIDAFAPNVPNAFTL